MNAKLERIKKAQELAHEFAVKILAATGKDADDKYYLTHLYEMEVVVYAQLKLTMKVDSHNFIPEK